MRESPETFFDLSAKLDEEARVKIKSLERSGRPCTVRM